MFQVQFIILSFALIFVNLGLGEVTKDVGMVRFYKELGCKMKPAGSKDPVSYECPSQTQSTEKSCVIKGKTYQLGDDIEAEPGVCLAACRCLNPLKAKRAKVICANLECPEHFGVPVRKQCTRMYSIDKCCATGLLCDPAAPKDPNDSTKVIFKSTTSNFTCNVGGVKHDEHSKYYPNELPCSRCVCMQGHDGTNKAPWCADIPCSIELRFNKELQDGCAPVFIKTSQCCPLQFRCPSKEDKVVLSSTTTASVKKADSKAVNDAAKLGPQCIFGDLKLNIGDKLSSPVSDTDLDCICQIPPFVTCSKTTL
uniref:VWFC domain-containing protein n=1 Tax=Cacopsylla melanoneura TaxID=428564 RepID=A0A8D8WL12_9HEMI